MAIELKFGLFWSGAPLSYLRYLTFKTLRHFHPDSDIILYVTDTFNNSGYKWGVEKQDFESSVAIIDYIDKLKDIGVNVVKLELFGKYPSNYQSDFFRWWFLKNNSGFYMDTDQIVLRSFDTLPLDSNIIFSAYQAKSCGLYTPVGVIGADNSEMVEWIDQLLPQFYEPNNYNSLGPFMFRTMLKMRKWKDVMFNAPSNYFYPIPDSYLVNNLYEGNLDLHEGMKELNGEIYSCHWFGGHPLSQRFNKKYTKELAKVSNDSLSKFLRKEEMI